MIAEQAASLEELKQDQETLRQELKRERAHLKAIGEGEREDLEKKVARLERREQLLTELIEEREDKG